MAIAGRGTRGTRNVEVTRWIRRKSEKTIKLAGGFTVRVRHWVREYE